MQLPASLDTLLAIAEEAVMTVLTVYRSPFDVELKGPDDPVTKADRLANQLICQRLGAAFPEAAVVAEESDPQRYGDYRHAAQVFFVDPVDGTREFVQRTGEFVVMIGHVENGRPRSGVIWAPTEGRVWIGDVGLGAFSRGPEEPWKPVRPSTTNHLGDARLVVSRTQSSEKRTELAGRLGVASLRPLGSAGLKGAMVASGQADAYLATARAGMLWDACAPDAIVTAAGGRFTDARGRAIDYRSDDLAVRRGLLASNGVLHQALLERLAVQP